MKTPDEEVADQIIENLAKSLLLSESELKKIAPKLARGLVTSQDWVAAFENDLVKARKAHDSTGQ